MSSLCFLIKRLSCRNEIQVVFLEKKSRIVIVKNNYQKKKQFTKTDTKFSYIIYQKYFKYKYYMHLNSSLF